MRAIVSELRRKGISNKFFFGLSVVALLLACWWCPYSRLPAPGWAVSCIAFAAAAMSVHEGMGRRQKALWLVAIGILLADELRAISKDRWDAQQGALRDRAVQDAKFTQVLQTQNIGFGNTKRQLDDSITELSKVLQTGRQVAELSKRNLESVTGGDAFAYVYPSSTKNGNLVVALNVHNQGDEPLAGVAVTIYRSIGGPFGSPSEPSANPVSDVVLQGLQIGSLAPREGRQVPNFLFKPVLGADQMGHYHIYVNAQNRGLSENLDFRLSKDGSHWEWSVLAWGAVSKRMRGDIFLDNQKTWVRILRNLDWRDSL